MRIYVDSNVFLSYFLREFGANYRFLEERVTQFLAVCYADKHVIIVSDWVVKECRKKHIVKKDIVELLEKSGLQFEGLKYTKQDIAKAYGFDTHHADALHIVLTRKAKADVIVTWNKKDFEGIDIRVMSPDEFS